ncbi:hydroxyquinol 1,2-dioxygenase [Bordetella genomosp. 8]|uniref:Hydroxyquinol 1,2-dioxygenase n=1 Tax=Bordetella genomosp. 8 TaxID=1416806 RepID=A0A1W6YL89_9BORD|nr:dioxygenase [Bordetella genomosp. 8]ARP81739.1 hydroxyquinol 1,2-dioxygenase [Bordetella genomosp. 8]
MSQPDPLQLTRTVLERIAKAPDPRFRVLMTTLVTKLHEFIREVDLTPEEWMAAIEFLTATGKTCTDKRQEFILLSDTLGASMQVVMLAQARASAAAPDGMQATPATEATVQGPYYWEGAPERELGSNIAEGVRGEPAYYHGRVTDTSGQPMAGVLLDVWSGDGEGVYDMQIEGQAEMLARARLRTDAEGRYSFWSIRPSYYPIPMDGPVGKMVSGIGQHPNRPGHIHFKVSAPGHVDITTHIFVANSPYIESDVVYGVRDSLIVEFQPRSPGRAPDGREMTTPYWTAEYDFRLAPARAS